MKTTIQVIEAKKILTELGIPIKKRFRTMKRRNGELVFFDNSNAFRGVRVAAKRHRRVWKKENGGREIFYEFGPAIGKMYDKETEALVISKEAELVARGVNIDYYVNDGKIFSVQLEFSYGEGSVRRIGK